MKAHALVLGMALSLPGAALAQVTTLTDGSGYRWDISHVTGAVAQGGGGPVAHPSSRAYWNWPALAVMSDLNNDGECQAADIYQATASPVLEVSGRQLALTPVNLHGLTVQRKIYVPETAATCGYARFQEILTNTSTSPISVKLRVGTVVPGTNNNPDTNELASDISDTDPTEYIYSSAGPGPSVPTQRITWLMTDDHDSTGSPEPDYSKLDPSVCHVVAQDKALVPVMNISRCLTPPNCPPDNLVWEYYEYRNGAIQGLTVQPGARAIVLHYQSQCYQDAGHATARLVCSNLAALPADAKAGMSTQDVQDVVNGPSLRAEANGPYNGVEGSALSLLATAYSGVGTVTEFAWDCTADGTYDVFKPADAGGCTSVSEGFQCTGSTGTCTYNAPGFYTARLRVTTSQNRVAYDDVLVTVGARNDPPVANPDSKQADEGTPLVFPATDLSANDTPGPPDETWQMLTVTAVSANSANGGTVNLSNGSVTYTPPQGFASVDTFTYTVRDNGLTNGNPDPKSSTGTVTVTVRPANHPPLPQDDSISITEDLPSTFSTSLLLANDAPGPAGESSQTLTVSAVSATTGAGGIVSISGTTITYTPAADYFGSDSFTYTVVDNGTTAGQPDPRSASASVHINVVGVNDAPVARDDATSAAQNTPVTLPFTTLLANDTAGPLNESGQVLTITNVTSPSAQGGTVYLGSSAITYTPAINFTGTDTFTYTVQDSGSTGGVLAPRTATATVTVSVGTVNQPPVPGVDHLTVYEDSPGLFSAGTLLVNDSPGPAGESWQTLTLLSISSPTPQGGTVTLQDGTITYAAPINFHGTDSFTYVVQDDGASSGVADPRTATGSVQLTVVSVNDPPATVADAKSVNQGGVLTFVASELTANDSAGPPNESGETLTVVAVASPSTQGGTVTLQGTVISYTPPTGFHGADTFTYVVQDNGQTNGNPDPLTASGTVNITVNVVNHTPTALADSYSTPEDARLTVAAPGVLGNDTSPDGLTLHAVAGQSPAHGTLTLNGDGSLAYQPARNYHGPDSFTYTATDGTLSSLPVTVSLTVTAVNDIPVALDDAYQGPNDRPLVIPAEGVLANDSDADLETLTAVLADPPAQGQLDLRADGSFTFTPENTFTGTVTFTYQAVDPALALSSPATVSILVMQANHAPLAQADVASTPEDNPVVIHVLDNDADPDGDTIAPSVVDAPAHGTAVVRFDKTVIYSPAPDFNGADSFSYRLSDGQLNSAPVAVAVTVTPVNDPPVLTDQELVVESGVDTPVPLKAFDLDGDLLTFTVVAYPTNGEVTGTPPDLHYTSHPGFRGLDFLRFYVNDGTVSSAVARLTLQVQGDGGMDLDGGDTDGAVVEDGGDVLDAGPADASAAADSGHRDASTGPTDAAGSPDRPVVVHVDSGTPVRVDAGAEDQETGTTCGCQQSQGALDGGTLLAGALLALVGSRSRRRR